MKQFVNFLKIVQAVCTLILWAVFWYKFITISSVDQQAVSEFTYWGLAYLALSVSNVHLNMENK